MGGDHAPEEIVAGAVLANRDGLSARMILVGDEARIAPLLAQQRVRDIEVVHAPGAIAMDANPSQAVRGSDDTSLGIAIAMLRDGLADAVVSAGNSGAFLAIALIRLRTIPGIDRPAIAVVFPGKKGPVILRDAGELMYESHASYSERLNLGSPETDLLCDIAGVVTGVLGARYCEPNRVAILCKTECVQLVIDALVGGYYSPRGFAAPLVEQVYPCQGVGIVAV